MTCKTSEVLTMGSVRTFMQIPDPEGCGRKTLYFGESCQKMEVDGISRVVRNAGAPIRTWQRGSRKFCTIGSNESPADNPQGTLRFYEDCQVGIPLQHTLGDCRIRVINNYGLCNTDATMATGWSTYAEVIDMSILEESRGQRSSYTGADDALSDEISVEIHNIYDISTVVFGEVDLGIDLTGLGCASGQAVFNDAVFGCKTGCGSRSCNCTESCDDGTRTFYVPHSCEGSTTAQYLSYQVAGSSTASTSVLPAATNGAVATPYPKVAVIGSTLYVMAYQNPAHLYSVKLDSRGRIKGSFSLVSVLTGSNGETTGVPASLVVDGDNLHALVLDTVAGSRLYSQGGARTPADGPRRTFDAAKQMQLMRACSKTIVVAGIGGALELSEDNGSTWRDITGPAGNAGEITSLEYADGRIVIGFDNGQYYYTSDDGGEWTLVNVTGISSQINSIDFIGDDVGWLTSASGVASTWVGGLNTDEWTTDDKRISGLPTGFVPQKTVLPFCANDVLASNTAIILGTNAAGQSSMLVGRPIITGA